MKNLMGTIAMITMIIMITSASALIPETLHHPNPSQQDSSGNRSGEGEEEPGSDRKMPEPSGQNEQRDKTSDDQAVDKPLLQETIKHTGDGKQVITNPASILACANKERNLPADYTPEPLVIPDIRFPYGENADLEKMYIRKDAAGPLKQLFNAAEQESIQLFGISGYRSYDRQEAVFASNVEQYGSEEKANQVSAYAGQSEHQTGLTMDVSTEQMNFRLEQRFGETKAGKWLADHAWEYGFIIRYPEGKEDITGYSYEPWHLRYVGKQAAEVIAEEDLTLEEFLSE